MGGCFDEKDMFVKKTRINLLSKSSAPETQHQKTRSKKSQPVMALRTLRIAIGTAGASGVALGAFGAHALKTQLIESGHWDTWHTAVTYQLIHTAAAFCAMTFASGVDRSSAPIKAAICCWLGGILFFSGSLFWLSLGGPRWVGPITPLGGLLLIAGWCCLLFRLRSDTNSEKEADGSS
jgi:uncharacterized membrane protein YgdD (TMEM256/DUF423 family)